MEGLGGGNGGGVMKEVEERGLHPRRCIWARYHFVWQFRPRNGQSRSLSSGFNIGTRSLVLKILSIERAKGVCHGQDDILAFRLPQHLLSPLLLLASNLSRDRFNRPAGTGYFPHDSRHFV